MTWNVMVGYNRRDVGGDLVVGLVYISNTGVRIWIDSSDSLVVLRN